MNNNFIKIILSILLLVCLLDMPYGYFQLVRFIATISFGYFAYIANQKNQKNEVIIYIALTLLFQPFIKIALGRTIWNIVDIIVAAGLLLSIFKDAKAKE